MASLSSSHVNNLAEGLMKININIDTMIKNVKPAELRWQLLTWIHKLERWFTRMQMFMI